MKNIFKRVADSFDQVRLMVTRKLPIPDMEGTGKYVEFQAKRDKQGFWSITSKHNVTSVTYGFQTVSRAYQAAVLKHTGKSVDKGDEFLMNFDTAFLILKDMEESLLKYNGTAAGAEPANHFMAAYRLLPQQFREGLDDLFFSRTEKKGEILAPKTAKKDKDATAQPASKTPDKPKPN
jgi:hypothetical protein